MFERLFRKQTREMKLEEISYVLIGRFGRERRFLEKKLSSACAGIGEQLNALDLDISRLGSKHVPGYSNIVKDKFCENATSSLRAVKSYSENFGSMEEFLESASQALASVGRLNVKEFRHLHAFAADMGSIAEKIRILEADIRHAGNLVSGSATQKVGRVNSMIEKLRELQVAAAAADVCMDEMKKSLRLLDSFIREDEAKIAALESGLLELQKEKAGMHQFRREMSFITQKIDNEFFGLSRPMKKFLYYGDLSKDHAAVLGEYIKSPSDAFVNDERGEIREILDIMHRFRNREAIELGEERLERVEEILRRFEFLLELREKYFLNQDKLRELEENLRVASEPAEREIRELAETLNTRKREMISTSSAAAEKEMERDSLASSISSTKARIEAAVSDLLGYSVKIV